MAIGKTASQSVVGRFRALHETGCFVLPNPWDIGSAIYLEKAGFKALASTSAGFAFSRGFSDEDLKLELVLAHFCEMAAATSLPLNADFQSGYAYEPEGVARNVKRCLAAGVAGLSIEDNTGRADAPLYEKNL
ncbi:MAG: isocitrate lyase/phosphoenolpyruvate mutase family protein, partial [Verrucomicrobiota bacterium]|nr:isocitrate lyase/phosphoenolpyruvate mutase family protein [Verrucomicrobiota bacterium]